MKSAMQILLLTIAATISSSTSIPRPVINTNARVKQHRAGAVGDLVIGEEHMLKIIVKWPPMRPALSYEICHGCHVIDSTGERLEDEETAGKVYPVDPHSTCGGDVCHVFKDVPKGKNRFNVRVLTPNGWSVWSEHVNFNVVEPGNPEHEHDEL
mmetsp:Transcript_30717/g.37515  ORF Transcript_30717/g.37515 Transcript_30717/m.37515 type:complete len:154 (+) Transcript_30717:90-551(+)|eukprot:CAMPEP_0172490380 /NCGR_PEP_ID=MMETSP1066-20121228/20770_1 /TAXON_ID=671091 /ORGANISM="Coscinodiscus wailesii, Strain CCMP2513" /LENGTH=153 /DNA_ID=CAMNT_0013258807 /DNA_START=90 /DNA_END=551 /DNA_ORIENTATION=+